MKREPKYPKITPLRALSILRELDMISAETRNVYAISRVRETLFSHIAAHLVARKRK